ncbi:MAG: hypothetical protein OXU62_10880, partial [Gammaproteobacteria bacterium]|nr:hypothetical protein [Gammaproteobacteria bacterium]
EPEPPFVVGVTAVSSVAFEGQDAVFRLYIEGGRTLPPNAAVVVQSLAEGHGGFSIVDDLDGIVNRVFTINRDSVEVRLRMARDSVVESGEQVSLRILSLVGTGGQPPQTQTSATAYRAFVSVRDTFDVTFTGPALQTNEGEEALFDFAIGNGLTNHHSLTMRYEVPDVNGLRANDFAAHLIRHNGGGQLVALPSSSAAGGGWLGRVSVRTNNQAAKFTLAIPTVDDNEPESTEQLCVQVHSIQGAPDYRLNLVTTGRVCGQVRDNDGALLLNLNTGALAAVGEGAQVTIPLTFTSPTHPMLPAFTRGQIHPGVSTYLHYAITGTATAGADYSVAAAPNSAFNAASGLGYLRLKPGIPNGDAGASPHRITINILGDAAAESAETVIVTPLLHGHNANLNFRDQGAGFRNPPLQHRSSQRQSITISQNAPVAVSVSALAAAYSEGETAVFQVCAAPGGNSPRTLSTRIDYRLSDGLNFGGDRYLTAADYRENGVTQFAGGVTRNAGYTQAAGGVLEIPAGGDHCQARISVPLASSNPFELPETLRLTLTGASGGGVGGAVVSASPGSDRAQVTIRQSSTIVHIGAPDACLRMNPADPACIATTRARDLTIEGDTWTVPVSIVAPADAAALTIRYALSGSTHTSDDGAATVLFDADDFSDPNSGVLSVGAAKVRGGGASITITMLDNMDTVVRDSRGNQVDEVASLSITSVEWQSASSAPLALADDFKAASTLVVDDEITVRVASCTVSNDLLCGDEYGTAEEGSGTGAFFEFTFYDAAGARLTRGIPNGVIRFAVSGDVTAGDYTDPAGGALPSASSFGSQRRHSITVLNDGIAENEETLTLTITAVEGGISHIDANHASADVTIPANGGLRIYTELLQAPAQAEPASGATTVRYQFCTAGSAVTSDASDDVTLAVRYAFSGSAIGARVAADNPLADYRRDNPPGELSTRSVRMRGLRVNGHRCFGVLTNSTARDIDILADDRNEPAETISVAITQINQIAGGAKNAAVTVQVDTTPVTYTIAANDPLTVTITACPASGACAVDSTAATEFDENADGGSSARYLVSYNGDIVPAATLTVNYRISGDVDTGDYADPGGVFSIAAGATTAAARTVSIGINNDSRAENAEDFIVDFTSVTGAAGSGEIMFTPVQFSAVIPANDGFQGRLTAVEDTVAEGQAAVFTFTAIGQLELVGLFQTTYSTGGTWEGAAADDDDEPFALAIDCRPISDSVPSNDIGGDGICRIQFSINIGGDDIVEADETLAITLSGGDAPAATVTITDATPLSVGVADAAADAVEGGAAEFALSFNLDDGVVTAE